MLINDKLQPASMQHTSPCNIFKMVDNYNRHMIIAVTESEL